MSLIRCRECGKEISDLASSCPNCGCPVDATTGGAHAITHTIEKKGNIKPLVIVIVAVLAIIIIGLAIGFMKPPLNEDEQLAYQNAISMKNMMKDPDSFKLYDEMFLLKHFDDNHENDYTYTIFKYGGTNGYGAIITDEAVFKNNDYVMDYADEPNEDDSNYQEQLSAQMDLLLYQLSEDSETWVKVNIDIVKIKIKMGME